MSQLVECILKAVLLTALIPLLVSLMRGRWQWIVRHQQRLLQMLVVLGAAAYVNFGGFHTNGSALHVWEQYHYFLGSRYFHELRYDGLYVATLEARRESHPEIALPARVRDL
ncbi:MAG: hypothetical protein ACJ8MR_07050, partial [Povalibacter sp.]